MFSWLGNILGSSTVVDGIKSGIDKSILTDEERLDYQKELLKAYEPFKIIQRVLALIVTVLFSLVLITEVSLTIIGAMWIDSAELAVEMINKLDIVGMLGYSFMAIMSLYFSGGVISSFKGVKK